MFYIIFIWALVAVRSVQGWAVQRRDVNSIIDTLTTMSSQLVALKSTLNQF